MTFSGSYILDCIQTVLFRSQFQAQDELLDLLDFTALWSWWACLLCVCV